jgi:hypothetical protein
MMSLSRMLEAGATPDGRWQEPAGSAVRVALSGGMEALGGLLSKRLDPKEKDSKGLDEETDTVVGRMSRKGSIRKGSVVRASSAGLSNDEKLEELALAALGRRKHTVPRIQTKEERERKPPSPKGKKTAMYQYQFSLGPKKKLPGCNLRRSKKFYRKAGEDDYQGPGMCHLSVN